MSEHGNTREEAAPEAGSGSQETDIQDTHTTQTQAAAASRDVNGTQLKATDSKHTG